jgi:glutathione-regulated potassium-efflux system ancillary protein KefC
MLIEDRVIEPRYSRLSPPEETPISPQECPVIIAGFGRFGQIVGRLLHAHHIPTTLLDHDPDHIEMVRRFGFNVFFGDAARLDLLHAAGADQARVLVIALDDPKTTLKLAELAHSHFPHLKIIARAWDLNQLFELTDIGIEEVYRETFDTALAAGEAVLRDLGFGAFEVHRAGKRFRAHDIESLQHIHMARKESVEHAIDAAIRAREELKELFAEDEVPLDEGETKWT